MSWLYLPVVVEDFLEVSDSAGQPFAMSRMTPSVLKSSSTELAQDTLMMPQSGMTQEPSTEIIGVVWWMSLLRASRANPSVLQEPGKLKMIPETDGLQQSVLLAKYVPDTHSWKMFPGWYTESTDTSAGSLLILPVRGMTRNGELYRLPKWEQDTKGSESGSKPSWPTWPTPGHTAWHSSGCRGKIAILVNREQYLKMTAGNFGQLNPDWVEWLMGWPVGWTDPDCETPVEVSWESDPADDGSIPRTSARKEHRINRLKTIGNGQVPECFEEAWRRMNDNLDAHAIHH